MPSIDPASILAVRQVIRLRALVLDWERMQAKAARIEAYRDVMQAPLFQFLAGAVRRPMSPQRQPRTKHPDSRTNSRRLRRIWLRENPRRLDRSASQFAERFSSGGACMRSLMLRLRQSNSETRYPPLASGLRWNVRHQAIAMRR